MTERFNFIEMKDGEDRQEIGEEIVFSDAERAEMIEQYNDYVAQRLSTVPIKISPIRCFRKPHGGEIVCIIPVNP